MSSISGKWKDPILLEDLMVALFVVLGPIPLEKQEGLTEYMNNRGHNVSWEAIR